MPFPDSMDILSRESHKTVRELAAHKTLLTFDYDGTLSPIVANREDAAIPDALLAQLSEIAEIFPVAVISGRSKADVAARLPQGIKWILGNHGYEGLSEITETLSPEAVRKMVENWHHQLMKKNLPDSCFELEDKHFSLTVHYRACADQVHAEKTILESIEYLEPKPRVVLGKAVVNLMHPHLPHKGTAVKTLLNLNGYERILFVGDDWNDEDVFEIEDERIVTVRIGFEAKSKAKFFLRNQHEISKLFQMLADERNTALKHQK